MSHLTLLNVRLFANGADLTSQSNKVELTLDVADNDVTTFLPEGDADSGWKKLDGGLKSSAIAAEGLWEAGDLGKVDDSHFASMGSRVVFTIGPNGASVGDLCYVTQALRGQYKLGGQVGAVHPWTANASGSGATARGLILHPPGTARTSTGTGTATEFIAASSSQTLYATLHVLSVSGSNPTLDVSIESDDTEDFDGSETTRITFTQADSIGGEAKSLAGPITDTWYRVSYTIGGTNPSFQFVVGIGIG